MVKTLYRPVGIHELGKILRADLRSFPARLNNQPIFYPVLNKDYAIQIASDWNTKDVNSGYCGFVTSFDVCFSYLEKYEIKQVGSNLHKEYWIPSENLEEFNSNIVGKIQIIDAYYGELYQCEKYDFKNKTIEKQIEYLENMF